MFSSPVLVLLLLAQWLGPLTVDSVRNFRGCAPAGCCSAPAVSLYTAELYRSPQPAVSPQCTLHFMRSAVAKPRSSTADSQCHAVEIPRSPQIATWRLRSASALYALNISTYLSKYFLDHRHNSLPTGNPRSHSTMKWQALFLSLQLHSILFHVSDKFYFVAYRIAWLHRSLLRPYMRKWDWSAL